jgi:hypothetical protein
MLVLCVTVDAKSKPPCRIEAFIEVLGLYIGDGNKNVSDHFKLSLMGNFELRVKLARKKNKLKRESDVDKRKTEAGRECRSVTSYSMILYKHAVLKREGLMVKPGKESYVKY